MQALSINLPNKETFWKMEFKRAFFLARRYMVKTRLMKYTMPTTAIAPPKLDVESVSPAPV